MLDDIIKERKKKLANLIESGVNPYPSKTRRTDSIAAVLKKFNELLRLKKGLFLAGRIVAYRDQGNLIFLIFATKAEKFRLF